MEALVPTVVGVPLLVAAALLGFVRRGRAADAFAVGTALVLAVVALLFVAAAADGTLVHWFGGWHPRDGIVPGVAFVVDPVAAGAASLAAVLATAALLSGVRYFEAVSPLYQALMLLFVGGMLGFAFSGDAFNLFVFYELIGVSAYALTGYVIRHEGPLQGAINFAVTNTIGSLLLLMGIGFLYVRTGTLNLAAAGRSLAGDPVDVLVLATYTLLVLGLLVKASIVPFHFWHADAHAVAPTPVCLLFAGIMLQLGLYAFARVHWTLFADVLRPAVPQLRTALVGAGVVTGLVAAAMCFMQTHLRRLLAFSSVAHTGLALMGVGLLSAEGLAGAALYVLGHGGVKAALFLCVGIVLHRLASIDELELHGRGRGLWATASLFAVGGLALSGLPPFGTTLGKQLIEEAATHHGHGWIVAVLVAVSGLTGGAVLRATGRVFLGLGPQTEEGEEEAAEPEEERETEEGHDHTPLVMVVPVVALLAGALAVGATPAVVPAVRGAAELFVDGSAYAEAVLDGTAVRPPSKGPHWLTVKGALTGSVGAALAVAVAAVALLRERLPRRLRGGVAVVAIPPLHRLRRLHSGNVTDYVAWLMAGAATFATLVAVLAGPP